MDRGMLGRYFLRLVLDKVDMDEYVSCATAGKAVVF